MEITEKRIDLFQSELLKWSEDNYQQFPWRETVDPYKILVSEFMLHRTRALQVQPVYAEFINEFPSLADFIKADEDAIRKKLKPLGLNWRIDSLINALKEISFEYGTVPTDYNKLLSIHGIGQYIAGATVCFSTNQNVSLVDTNTLRVIGRYWGFAFDEKSRKKKETTHIIGEVTASSSPKILYYTIIDLAHLVCKTRELKCNKCPIKKIGCNYHADICLDLRSDTENRSKTG